MRLRNSVSTGRPRYMATAHFAVQRPSLQSARRLAKRMSCSRSDSVAQSQSLWAGTSSPVCCSQNIVITIPRHGESATSFYLPNLGRLRQLPFLFHTALHRMDEIRAKMRRRDNAVQGPYSQGPLYGVDAIELSCHFPQFFGMYDFEEFVPLGAQAPFLHTVRLGHRIG